MNLPARVRQIGGRGETREACSEDVDWLVTHALATSGLPLERLGLVRRVQAQHPDGTA